MESFDNAPELQCEQWIRSVDLEKMLILIVSEKMASDIVRQVHDYPQIKAVFIVSSIESKNALLANWSNFLKVRIVSTNELASRMDSFESRWLRNKFEQFPFDLFDITKATGCTSTDLNGEFLTTQHLIYVLIHLKSSVTDKDEFIDQCTKALRKCKPVLLKDVQDFRNGYTPSNALTYYTKPSIFFRLLNTALRTRSVDFLFLCRFFIRDISNRLMEKQCQHPVRVYRGQRMRKEERQRLEQSIGQLISVSSFLSTTLNRKVAMQYIGDTKIQIIQNDVEEFVMFDICADPKRRSKPFAIIEENAAISEEQEVLFGVGSIFYLKSVRCEVQGDEHHPIWVFEMELNNEEEHELKYLFHRLLYNYATEGITELPLSSFGLLLCNMGQHKFASQLFRRILRELPSTNVAERARCQLIMGNLGRVQHHYWQSLRWYKRSVATYAMINLSVYSAEVASVYDGIGHVYAARKQYRRAHISYQKSLFLWQTYYNEDQDHEEIAFCYMHEVTVYLAEGEFDKARELARKVLDILYKCYLDIPTHPNLASAHLMFGDVLLVVRMFDLAIDHYTKSLIIALKTLSDDNSFLYSGYSKLEIACEKAGKNFTQLLTDKAIPIIQDQVFVDHFNKNNGTPYQMLFKCPRCKQWQWIFTVFRPVKRFVCTGCWKKRYPGLMSKFWVLT